MNKVKLTGQLRNYLRWPMLLTIPWLIMVVLLFLFSGAKAGLTGLLFFAVYLAFAGVLYMKAHSQLMNEMISFASEYGQIQRQLLTESGIPYAMLDVSGNFLWMNKAFARLTGHDAGYSKHISTIFEDVRQEDLPLEEEKAEFEVMANDRAYRARMTRVRIDGLLDEEDLLPAEGQEFMISVCLSDETELHRLSEEKDQNMNVCGLLTLDNYDEVLEGVEDVRKSLLLALVERKISKYFSEADGVVRKLGHDKYFFVLRKRALEELEDTRFSLLDDVKTVNIGNEIAMTVSIGIGLGTKSYHDNAEAAQVAMELALGRGGDQVVVKEGYKTRFFGGRSESTEKFTRVKARVKAQALKEIISGKSRIVIMGHKISDIDAMGAAIGLYRAAKTIGKPAHIVADDVADSVKPVIQGFLERRDEYNDMMFVDRKKAKELTNADTAVIVVDTNKAGYTACDELLTLTNSIVVFDHHRQGVDRIENAVLSYIEPYASSACEMIAEVLQYFDETVKLRGPEADAMYAGIVIDTSNFMTRTGVRTFEAAAYLRRNGADITHVRKMFRENAADVRAKAQAIADAELFEGKYAISVCPSEGLSQPTIVSAQAANELLNVKYVKASFVVTDYNGMIYISARAIDEVNVQLIMERLGGGGHLNISGAQLQDYTLEEAVSLLKKTILEMQDECNM